MCAVVMPPCSVPDPKGSKATVENIFEEAMCSMKNTANKVWAMVKNIRVTVTGKIKLGFIEIAVAPLNTCRLVRACFFFVMVFEPHLLHSASLFQHTCETPQQT